MSEEHERNVDQPRRRRLIGGALGTFGTLIFALSRPEIARGANLLGVRVWPARDYTRVAIEHDADLKFSHFFVRDGAPLRLVVDIEGIDLTPQLRELVGKVEPDDPYIQVMRIGQNRPNVVRLVVELKADVEPQVFSLEPVGPYQYRLVLDLYPTVAPDPLMALLRGQELSNGADGSAVASADNEAELARDVERSVAQAERESRGALRKPAPEPRPQQERFITVAIDPGHGGEDPGAVGKRGTLEKHVTLAIAQRLRALIDAEPNMRVMLTRDGDYFVPLRKRVDKARRVQADIFVSIHADAWIKPTVRGSSVFALSERGATSTAAAWLARRENDADLIGGVNLGDHDAGIARVLLDLSTTAQINDSLRVGGAVLRELERVNSLHRHNVEQAGFAVLKAPDIPSILIETAFISNPDEERRLKDERYQQQMAQAIFRGIKRYFEKHPPAARNPVG